MGHLVLELDAKMAWGRAQGALDGEFTLVKMALVACGYNVSVLNTVDRINLETILIICHNV